MSAQITIALDYDNTFDRMPAVWSRFIVDARQCGCRVFIVSSRHCFCDEHGKCENHREVVVDMGGFGDFTVPVILTSGSAKKWFLEQRGINVDIWIDDDPASVIGPK